MYDLLVYLLEEEIIEKLNTVNKDHCYNFTVRNQLYTFYLMQ